MTNTDVFIEVITSENKDEKERNDARRKGIFLLEIVTLLPPSQSFLDQKVDTRVKVLFLSDIIRCADRISKEASVKRSK